MCYYMLAKLESGDHDFVGLFCRKNITSHTFYAQFLEHRIWTWKSRNTAWSTKYWIYLRFGPNRILFHSYWSFLCSEFWLDPGLTRSFFGDVDDLLLYTFIILNVFLGFLTQAVELQHLLLVSLLHIVLGCLTYNGALLESLLKLD